MVTYSARLWHGSSLPLTKYMAKLLRVYDVYPVKLPLLVILVSERAKMLERALEVQFGF